MTGLAPSDQPHSIEAEQQLLGALLCYGEALELVENIVDAADFFEPLHRFLFEQFLKARDEGRRLSLPLVNALLTQEVKHTDIAGLTVSQYLARLAAGATTIVNAPDFARVVAEYADRRRIMSIGEALAGAAQTTLAAPAILATDSILELDAIATRRSSQHIISLSVGSAAEQSISRMQSAMANQGKITGVTTGIRKLDEKLNGWQRGDFVILAGRPGMGKSGLIISSARQSAEKGANVILFSLEMSAESVTDRMLTDTIYRVRNPIAYFDLARGNVSNEQAEVIIEAQQEFRRLSIKIDPQGALTASQIAARARRHKQLLERHGRTLDLVIVDHLHIMKASSRYAGNRVAEVTEISASLKALAKELNVPVVALAQLSRQVEARDDKQPTLADLRDSGSLEQDADAILFVYREGYYLQTPMSDRGKDEDRLGRLAEVKNRVDVHIAKHRAGPTGRVELFFDPASNALRDPDLFALAELAK